MVVTRSGTEQERAAIEQERLRRSLEAPAAPNVQQGAEATQGVTNLASRAGPSTQPTTEDRYRSRSPGRSVRSQRSTASAAARAKQAEYEAAEKLALLKKKELEIEAELIRKRLAADLQFIQDDQESPIEERTDHLQKVDAWLRRNAPVIRGEGRDEPSSSKDRHLRFDLRKSPVTRTRGVIDGNTEGAERAEIPRSRCPDLPEFHGAPNEWLAFQAAYLDSTRLYQLSPTENLLRLRSCVKGKAREYVAALLHSASHPDEIIRTLHQCYGRPEFIVDQALQELRRLPCVGTSVNELNELAVRLKNVVCVLRGIERRGYLDNPQLMREALGKLTPHMTARWYDYATENEDTTDPEIVVLSRFLMRESDRAMRHTYAPSTSTSTTKAQTTGARKKYNPIYNIVEEEREKCPSCKKSHKLTECPVFKALTIDERWILVRDNKLCFKCIVMRHRRTYCKAKPCGTNQCNRPHHPMLHQQEHGEAKQLEKSAESVLSVTTARGTGPQTVLLKMCPVTVVGPRGEIATYALLDEGATISLIDENLARSIGARGPITPLQMQGVNNTQREDLSELVTVQLKTADNTLHRLKARTVRDMKLRRQSVPCSLLSQEHLRDLPEDMCYDSTRPRILIGSDHWEYIVSQELRVGKQNQPAASRTKLGWVLHGTLPRSIWQDEDSMLHIFTPETWNENRDTELHELVERHFQLEALGIAHKPHVSDTNRRAIEIVERTITKTERGYEVGLPWKNDDVQLPRSYDSALRRLRRVEQKMDTDPAFAEEYTKQVNNLLQKGYAVPCEGSEEESHVSWFLPHFAVQNPNKPGKQRLVFDAAAKSHGVCLNDYLLEGPDLLRSLLGILFRFREHRVAVTADVQEMFLQIKIRREDQPAQQFLWRGTERQKPPQHFKMTSVIFGAASSPFIAHFVRDHNAKRHAETHPLACEAITRDHYMDDLVASFKSEDEARRAISEMRTVHAAAGFTLRAWNASDVSVLEEVPEQLRATTPTKLGDDSPKILGLHWDAGRDELGFNTSMSRVPFEVRARIRPPTKREALSAVMSIFDPLSLLSHYTIRAKIILQSLWRLKTTWDEPIPTEENKLFATWLEQLDDLARLRLPRRYGLEDLTHQGLELHIMCDASEQAYATVAYWRMTRPDGSVELSLVAAKAKVAPKRTQTIPRLELQAAVIGARLADTIRREHRVEILRTVYWTDSMTVLHWIRHDARRYTPFVAHRLGELAELTNTTDWRWVPTNENVADDATRIAGTPITTEDRWFQGPGFLRLPEEEWPAERSEADNEEEVILNVTEAKNEDDEWLPDPSRFSKFETLVRAAARVLAFIDICRRRATRMELQHVEKAERALFQRAQRDSFPDEIRKLKQSRPITKGSRLYRIDPVLEEGLLRARGRIDAASAPSETKKPVILDGRHPLTKLVVLREHCAAGHANRERVTNDLRQRYWIIHLRPTVRATERTCALCRVRRTRPLNPATGDLPRARLEPFQRPFTYCGTDYFGPMIVKIGRRREKRWGALYTCLTSRAVHLELVPSLSSGSAIMALRRMAARRGWPRIMYSDNATNFRGADKELRDAYTEWEPALREEGLLHRMEWRFIPPGAPNQGGAWERLVRSVKVALGSTLAEKEPTEEVLNTLLTEAEYSINARPLTHVSVDPKDPEAITPNHFLLGSSTGLPSTGPCSESDRRTWRASMALADHFWRRWVREYLPTLVPRGESSNNQRRLRVGDVVIVVDSNLPRNVWPMGIVQRVYEGPDGGVRVADVKTRSGIFKRPANKLVVLVQEEATRAAPGGEM